MSTLYCPRCASQAIEGQRFCRNCGINLGLILDAMDGKRASLDIEALKEDLLQFGNSLRNSFEEVRANIKRTQRFGPSTAANASEASCAPRTWSEMRKKEREDWTGIWKKKQEEQLRLSIAAKEMKLKEKYGPRSRKYSLQQAALSIFSGGAMTLVLYNLLNTAASSGLLANLEQVMVRELLMPEITGWVPVFQLLWLIGLIPVARGFAHLINGIFFAPKPEMAKTEQPTPAPGFVREAPDYSMPGVSTTTNELENKLGGSFPPSVTEEPTLQFAPQKTSDK